MMGVRCCVSRYYRRMDPLDAVLARTTASLDTIINERLNAESAKGWGMTQRLGTGRTTGAESFWYILGCIAAGAAYFAKVPAKKALSEYGLCELTGAEKFWYVVMNIGLGSGYLAKVITKKALSEVTSQHGG